MSSRWINFIIFSIQEEDHAKMNMRVTINASRPYNSITYVT